MLFLFVFLLGCDQPALIVEPVGLSSDTQLLDKVHTYFACSKESPGRWGTPPGPPADVRTVLDVYFSPASYQGTPAPDSSVAQLGFLKARVLYRFNISTVRVEARVADVPSIYNGIRGIDWIETVRDTANRDVHVNVHMSRAVTDADYQAAKAATGREPSKSLNGLDFHVIVPDSTIPALRQLPGVQIVQLGWGYGCAT